MSNPLEGFGIISNQEWDDAQSEITRLKEQLARTERDWLPMNTAPMTGESFIGQTTSGKAMECFWSKLLGGFASYGMSGVIDLDYWQPMPQVNPKAHLAGNVEG